MVQRCNAVGVRIYVDAVINHMAAGSGVGSSGTYFSTWPKTYPNVPFYDQNFNDRKCRTSSGNIENYNDIFQVRDCKLVGLPDLDLGSDYVRDKIVNYLNTLIDIGVAGFRIDAVSVLFCIIRTRQIQPTIVSLNINGGFVYVFIQGKTYLARRFASYLQ